MQVINSNIKSRRGTAMSNVNRGLNIAGSSRNVAKLDLYDQAKVNNLIKFSKHANYLGNGLVLIDVGTRVGNIHNSYQADGNWERELFKESLSFMSSAIASTITVKGGVALLTFLTPFGWGALLVGGLAVTGTAVFAGYKTNEVLQSSSDDVYTTIMKFLN